MSENTENGLTHGRTPSEVGISSELPIVDLAVEHFVADRAELHVVVMSNTKVYGRHSGKMALLASYSREEGAHFLDQVLSAKTPFRVSENTPLTNETDIDMSGLDGQGKIAARSQHCRLPQGGMYMILKKELALDSD